MRTARENSLRSLLAGGDRRSIAQSNEARALVRADPSLVRDLARLAEDDDRLVSMRALDLMEKLARERPEWITPYKDLFIGPIADSPMWEVRLQIVRALPLFEWTPADRPRVLEILHRNIGHANTFVRVWALDGLARLARYDDSLLPAVNRTLGLFERSGSKAMASRARAIRQRLAGGGLAPS